MLNFLCETLNKKGLDWNKLTAVVWYADVVSSEDIEKIILELLENWKERQAADGIPD